MSVIEKTFKFLFCRVLVLTPLSAEDNRKSVVSSELFFSAAAGS